jgi:hypothetical protein
MKSGIELIADERSRQVSQEGWTPEHDDEHDAGELIKAAVAYADCNPTMKIRGEKLVLSDQRADVVIYGDPWPWQHAWDKRNKHSQIRRLQIAGALIAAEIDRLQRKAGGQ